LDIGCGTGNLTDELINKLSHDKIIAFDISDPMIKFAKKNYKRATIKYVTADICDEWHKLKKKLSLRKESVDLVISIYCLHWVSDLKQAMDNVTKLLKPGFV
jgi:ubiquinone/menaquinone biosynthesis C-methylase UbiE